MHKLRPIILCVLAVLFLHTSLSFSEQPPQVAPDHVITATDTTFNDVLLKLFNNNCTILAANQQLGLITFKTQSEEYPNSARRRVNILEGTILVLPERMRRTQIRVKLALRWQESNDTAGTFKTGAQKEAGPEWYKFLFGVLGLPASTPNN